MRRLVDVVKKCYSERLGCFIVGANWFFYSMFQIITPSFEDKMRQNQIETLKEASEYFDHGMIEEKRLD